MRFASSGVVFGEYRRHLGRCGAVRSLTAGCLLTYPNKTKFMLRRSQGGISKITGPLHFNCKTCGTLFAHQPIRRWEYLHVPIFYF
jgi:hypothetical protein